MNESEPKFQELIERAIDVIYTTDEAGRIMYISPRVHDLFNIAPEFLKDKFIMDFLKSLPLLNKEQQIANNITLFKQVMAAKKDEYSYLIKLFDETEKFFQVNCRLIWDTEKKVLLGSEGIIHDITQIHRLQNRLDESEAKYYHLINNLADLLIEIDTHGIILYANSQVMDILGYQPEEVCGKNILTIIHPDDVQNVADTMRETIISKRTLSSELRIRHKQGHYLHVSGRANLVKQNRQIKLVGILRDITGRKILEESLRKSEYELKERIKELICAYGLSRIAELPNISIDGILQSTLALLPPACQFPTIACARVIFDNKEYKTSNFQETPWEFSTKVEITGKVLQIILYYLEEKPFLKEEEDLITDVGKRLKNIIEQKEMETKLRESEEKFRTLVETTSDWVWEVDETGVYTYCSPKIKDILGYEPAEILGKTPFDLMPKDEATRVGKIFGALVDAQKPIEALENINMHKDGRHIILETSGIPLIDAVGNFTGYRGIDREITERKQAEQKLESAYKELKELDRLKDEFYADITHEFRTPLVAIKGFVELLVKSTNLDEVQRQDLETILRNEGRLEHLVNEMLEYFRLQSGKVQFKTDSFRVSNLLTDLKQELEPMLKEKQLVIEAALKPDDTLFFDKNQITKVIKNFLTNAINFSYPTGKIIITSTIEDSVWTFALQDQGIGIAKNDIPKIFSRFTRLETSKEMNMSGVGLGLALSKNIIDAYGGKIWVESDGKNKGSTFNFQLDLHSNIGK